jgi:hypothetical protein
VPARGEVLREHDRLTNRWRRNEATRDVALGLAETEAFAQSHRKHKLIEMHEGSAQIGETVG